jgi:cytochrome c-type biogenesis protein CcmH/NrfG
VVDSRIDELRRRLERDPGSRLFAQLAEEYRKAGDHAEAIRVARSGLTHHPSYPSARLTLGRALLESGDPAGARVELETALREAPDNILASRFLGQVLEAQGDFKAALERYEATLRMAPGDRQLELQIRAVQKRMEGMPHQGGVQGPAEGAGAPPTGELPEEQGSLPPTIRIHMPQDRGGRTPERPAEPPPVPQAPRPAPQGSRPPATSVPPVTLPVQQGSRPPATSVPPVTLPVHQGSRPPVPSIPPVTLPGPKGAPPPVPASAAGDTAAVPIEAPTDAGRVAASSEGSARAPLSAEPFYESDAAPTLPTAQPPEFDSSRGGVAPTEERESNAVDLTLEAEPVEAFEVEEVEQVPTPATESQPIGTEAAAASGEGATPFSSSTLAELYFRQGLVDRAAEVYRQLLATEPENAKARERLAEILAAREAGAVDGPVAGADEERSARRRGLERTIARLEALLSVVRRA